MQNGLSTSILVAFSRPPLYHHTGPHLIKRTMSGNQSCPPVSDPGPTSEKDSSLKIKIELDLEAEVGIYVNGDVTIGLL
jgi:hypothetical protein